MRTAQILFQLPTTRVNGVNLAESEIARVEVYDNCYDGDRSAGEDPVDIVTDPVADPVGPPDYSEHRPMTSHEFATSGYPLAPGAQPTEPAARATEARRRRGKVGTWTSEKSGRLACFKTGELSTGVHFFQLIAIDTEGRVSTPSGPFRLNVAEDGNVDRPDKHDEPNQVHNVGAASTDPAAPSMVTQVEVKLL